MTEEAYARQIGSVACLQPIACGLVELRRQRLEDVRVIRVEPGAFFPAEHIGDDQPAVDRRQRQRLEAHHLALAVAAFSGNVTSTTFSMRMP